MRHLNTKSAVLRSVIKTRIERLSSKIDPAVPKVKNFINGEFVDSTTTNWIPLYNPGKWMSLSVQSWSLMIIMMKFNDLLSEYSLCVMIIWSVTLWRWMRGWVEDETDWKWCCSWEGCICWWWQKWSTRKFALYCLLIW